LISSENPIKKKQEEHRVESILNYYTDVAMYDVNMPKSVTCDISKFVFYKNSIAVQFLVLYLRGMMNSLRDKRVFFVKFLQQIIMAILVGLVFLRLGHGQTDVQNRMGALFFILTNQIMTSLMGSVSSFHNNRPILFRERGAKLYNVGSYYLAQVFIDLPFNLFFPLVFGSVSYYLVGLNENVERFFLFILISACISITGNAVGTLMAVVAPNFGVVMVIMPLITTIFMMFGGFYKSVSSIKPYFIWLYWLSIVSITFVSNLVAPLWL